MNAPRNKYSEIIQQVKENLAIVIVDTIALEQEQELTKLGKDRVEHIKKQVFRIAKLLEKLE